MISHIPGASRTNVGGFIKHVRSAGRFAQPQPSGAPLYLKERAEAFMLKKDWEFHRGELYYANLNPFFGSEQGGNRPVLVLQNNIGNIYCPTLIVAPLTSNIYKKASQPTHYILESVRGLRGQSIVLLEQITTIDKRRADRYIGKLSRDQMDGIDEAIRVSLDIDIPEEVEAP
jgi:mRNA interferase MazF